MFKLALITLCVLVAGPVTAQAPTAPSLPAPTLPASVAPDKVLSAAVADWNDDGTMDRAVLIGGDSDADLLIYLSDGDNGLKAAAYAPGLVFSGAMAGTFADLQLSPQGGLQVHSENGAVGRDRWDQILTLAWRDGQFVVAGVTYGAVDTLDPTAGGNCDINLLTGKGTANGKTVKLAPVIISVTKWTDDSLPAPCQF